MSVILHNISILYFRVQTFKTSFNYLMQFLKQNIITTYNLMHAIVQKSTNHPDQLPMPISVSSTDRQLQIKLVPWERDTYTQIYVYIYVYMALDIC